MFKLSVGLVRQGTVMLAIGSASMFLVNACGEVGADGTLVEPTESALDKACRNATPALTFQGHADVTSPSTYNQCFKAYVIQVNNLERFGTGGSSANPRVTFKWGGNGIGMTQTECEQAWVGGDIFVKQSDGTFSTQDAVSRHGSWVPLSGSGGITGRCDTDITSFNVSEGKTYKIAASARTAGTSAAPTRPVHIITP